MTEVLLSTSILGCQTHILTSNCFLEGPKDRTNQVIAIQCAGYKSQSHTRYGGGSKERSDHCACALEGKMRGSVALGRKGTRDAKDRGPCLSLSKETHTHFSSLKNVLIPGNQVWNLRIRFSFSWDKGHASQYIES